MKFSAKKTEVFIPDGRPDQEAFARTTRMAIAAHQDDLEIMAYDGILACFGRTDEWFCGVVVTNGAGSPRDGLYRAFTDDDMMRVRAAEQRKAAVLGEYGLLVQLGYSSSEVKDKHEACVIDDLKNLIAASKPQIIYTHNLADKHDTHIAVGFKVIRAIRALPAGDRPDRLYGCEVWRDLDWLPDPEKVVFDVSAHPNLAMALLEVFDSQICGGKRYDLATAGRRIANATYAASHAVDQATAVIHAMDLTPLIKDDTLDVDTFIRGSIYRFMEEVSSRLSRY